jgi:hypothetical protein
MKTLDPPTGIIRKSASTTLNSARFRSQAAYEVDIAKAGLTAVETARVRPDDW